MINIERLINDKLIKYLAKEEILPSVNYQYNFTELSKQIKPGDVLLVEGKSNFSKGIKYLTQSIWSHSAIYIGSSYAKKYNLSRELTLFEADIEEGVRVIPLDFYKDYHVRICRPKQLSKEELDKMMSFLLPKVGHHYDLKHIFDLMKYLVNPPMPNKYKRAYLELGSGDPSRVICSSIIAEAFQLINYPILPEKERETFKKRNYTLYTPRDYDTSPFFQIIKPTLKGFDLEEYQRNNRE